MPAAADQRQMLCASVRLLCGTRSIAIGWPPSVRDTLAAIRVAQLNEGDGGIRGTSPDRSARDEGRRPWRKPCDPTGIGCGRRQGRRRLARRSGRHSVGEAVGGDEDRPGWAVVATAVARP